MKCNMKANHQMNLTRVLMNIFYLLWNGYEVCLWYRGVRAAGAGSGCRLGLEQISNSIISLIKLNLEVLQSYLKAFLIFGHFTAPLLKNSPAQKAKLQLGHSTMLHLLAITVHNMLQRYTF